VLGEDVWRAVEADWRTAPIDEKLRAMLGFLEKLTLRPGELSPADADAVRAAGVSDEAIEDALVVGSLFNMIDRMADSLDWDVPTWEQCLERGEAMLAGGYSLAPASA
jgi:alkylhydroperoxidase family enzyme